MEFNQIKRYFMGDVDERCFSDHKNLTYLVYKKTLLSKAYLTATEYNNFVALLDLEFQMGELVGKNYSDLIQLIVEKCPDLHCADPVKGTVVDVGAYRYKFTGSHSSRWIAIWS